MSGIKRQRKASAKRLSASVLGQFHLDSADAADRGWRAVISQRSSAVLRHKVANGERVGGPPYGYAAIGDGTAWVPVSREQAVIRWMLNARAEGNTYAAIADQLNRFSIPTKKSGCWHPRTVQRTLGLWHPCTVRVTVLRHSPAGAEVFEDGALAVRLRSIALALDAELHANLPASIAVPIAEAIERVGALADALAIDEAFPADSQRAA